MNLTPIQIAALRMTDRGLPTLIIDMEKLAHQPVDFAAAAQELHGLVSLGLVTRERISQTRFKFTITDAGHKAARVETATEIMISKGTA